MTAPISLLFIARHKHLLVHAKTLGVQCIIKRFVAYLVHTDHGGGLWRASFRVVGTMNKVGVRAALRFQNTKNMITTVFSYLQSNFFYCTYFSLYAGIIYILFLNLHAFEYIDGLNTEDPSALSPSMYYLQVLSVWFSPG